MSIACLFTVYMTLLKKLCFKTFPKCSHRICLNFAITEATKGDTSSLKRFLKKIPRTEKYKDK